MQEKSFPADKLLHLHTSVEPLVMSICFFCIWSMDLVTVISLRVSVCLSVFLTVRDLFVSPPSPAAPAAPQLLQLLCVHSYGTKPSYSAD